MIDVKPPRRRGPRRRTHFVVAGSEPGATKMKRARELHEEIVDEAEFLRRLATGPGLE